MTASLQAELKVCHRSVWGAMYSLAQQLALKLLRSSRDHPGLSRIRVALSLPFGGIKPRRFRANGGCRERIWDAHSLLASVGFVRSISGAVSPRPRGEPGAGRIL